MGPSIDQKGESHRIYWQTWTGNSQPGSSSRRELVTSSAAVRLFPAARALDVTTLLRKTIQLPTLSEENSSLETDSLVLVGTLYSLPRDYVQFEHESLASEDFLSTKQTTDSFAVTVSTSLEPLVYTAHSRSDPFHVVRSLKPSDSPLDARDRMNMHLKHLQSHQVLGRTIISPKLQWYYVPALSPGLSTGSNSSLGSSENVPKIPNCIDLEGYATSMDDEGPETDEEDFDHQQDLETNLSQDMASRFAWIPQEDSNHTSVAMSPSRSQSADSRAEHEVFRKRSLTESRRLRELNLSRSSPQTMSGYLWKQSRRDRNVWRKVHSVLTDDYFWFVSRIHRRCGYAFSHHGRVRLTRALLLEPTADYAPLFRTPHAFEVVSARGASHTFRAADKATQKQWMEAISDRIVQSYENSLIEDADLIVTDESLARNRRWNATAVDPLLDTVRKETEEENDFYCKRLQLLLRWGLRVAEFKEICRYIFNTLPAKKPVVVTSPDNRRSSAANDRAAVSRTITLDPMDTVVGDMIRAAWESAVILLQEATSVVHLAQPTKSSHSVETHFRHVDYIITGRHQHTSTAGESTDNEPIFSHHEPPPIDLFDPLLAELQVFVR
jgi:hypothetical protein